jgi:hypothetical protein
MIDTNQQLNLIFGHLTFIAIQHQLYRDIQ